MIRTQPPRNIPSERECFRTEIGIILLVMPCPDTPFTTPDSLPIFSEEATWIRSAAFVGRERRSGVLTPS